MVDNTRKSSRKQRTFHYSSDGGKELAPIDQPKSPGGEGLGSQPKQLEIEIPAEICEVTNDADAEVPVPALTRGHARPKTVRTGKPGRPRREPNWIPVEPEQEASVGKLQG